MNMPEISFKIPFTLPGWNEWEKQARGNKFAAAKMKEKLTHDIGYIAKVAAKGQKFDAVTISFTWIEKDRRRDPDNIIAGKKFIIDGIVAAGILKNDGWKQVAGLNDSWEVGADHGCLVVVSVAGVVDC